MKRIWMRVCALALCLCALAGNASAGIVGVDEALSAYFDINRDVSMAVGITVDTLAPFSQATVDMLNGVLKHVSMEAETGEERTSMSLTMDGERLLGLEEKREGAISSLTASLLPNRTLTSAKSALDAFLAPEEEEEAFDALRAVSEAEACYQALTDAISPFAEEKKANYKIAGIGHAKWVRLARLTPEQSAQLLQPLTALLGCGMDAAFRQSLATLSCKNGFTVALYRLKEDGDDIAVYIKGNVALAEGESRTLAYQWAFSRDGQKAKDTYKLELIKAKAPAQRRVIEASRTSGAAGDDFSLTLKSSVLLKDAAGTVTTTRKQTLAGKASGAHTTLAGETDTTVKTVADGDTSTVSTVIKPDLTLTSAEGSGVLSGTVSMTEKTGKTVARKLTFTFSDDPARALREAAADGSLYEVAQDEVSITINGSSLAQNAQPAQPGETNDFLVGNPPAGMTAYTPPASMQTVDLDGATPEAVAALRDELFQNAAGVLIRAIAALPAQDAALLADNMTQEDYAALQALLGDL